jgi:hypothetical protein
MVGNWDGGCRAAGPSLHHAVAATLADLHESVTGENLTHLLARQNP